MIISKTNMAENQDYYSQRLTDQKLMDKTE